MKCREAEQWMDAALDAAMAREAGEPGAAAEVLPSGWRAQLDAHLEGCARCRQLWTQLGAAHAALRVPRPVPAPAGMLAEFHRRAADAERPTAVRPRPQPWLWIWPLASAAAGATAAWMIAAHVAPISTPSPLPQMSQRTVPPPLTAPDKGPVSESDKAAAAPTKTGAPNPLDTRRQQLPTISRPANPFAANTELADKALQRGYHDFYTKGKLDRLAATPPPQSPANTLAERLESGDKPADRSLSLGAELQAAPKRVNEEASRPSILDLKPDPSFYYRGDVNATLADSQDPPELRVSPAVLTALQRTVEPSSTTTSVQQAASVLSQAADVAVEVDPRVAHRTVTLSESGVPLWKALEVVAEQSHAQVLPVRDHLVLKPVSDGARVPRIAGAVRLNKAPTGLAAAAAPAPAGTPGPAGVEKPSIGTNRPAAPAPPSEVQARGAAPAEPRQEKRPPSPVAAKAAQAGAPGQRAARPRAMDSTLKQDSAIERYSAAIANSAPDRKVWGEAWGTLPERGFAVPSPEEIPPQTLGLDANSNSVQSLRQTAPGQQQLNNVLRRNRQQNSR